MPPRAAWKTLPIVFLLACVEPPAEPPPLPPLEAAPGPTPVLPQIYWPNGPTITKLHLPGPLVYDLAAVTALRDLEVLEVDGFTKDIGPIAGLSRLRKVSIKDLVGIVDLAPLATLPALEELRTSWVRARSNEPLDRLSTNLTVLDLGRTAIADKGFVSRLTRLQTLVLDGAPSRDLGPPKGAAGSQRPTPGSSISPAASH